jgi:hypothetical protein
MFVTAWIIVSWFFGLCALYDVMRQPNPAFLAAGHSKRTWILIEVIGTLLSFTGIATWVVYSIRIRPSVVKAGGRRPRKRVFLRTFFGELATSKPRAGTARERDGATSYAAATKETCSSCRGRGQQPCFTCQGRGRITTPRMPPQPAGRQLVFALQRIRANIVCFLQRTRHLALASSIGRGPRRTCSSAPKRPPPNVLGQLVRGCAPQSQSGRRDLNSGPLVPQTSALTRLRHAPRQRNGSNDSPRSPQPPRFPRIR